MMDCRWIVLAAGRVFLLHFVGDQGVYDISSDQRDLALIIGLGAIAAVAIPLGVAYFTVEFLRKQQEELRRQREKARIAAAVRETHARTLHWACHHMRNPLWAIRATAELMLASETPPDKLPLLANGEADHNGHVSTDERIKDLATIVRSSDQLSRLLDDLADFTQVEMLFTQSIVPRIFINDCAAAHEGAVKAPAVYFCHSRHRGTAH
jgi:signal transduction histidine kinase